MRGGRVERSFSRLGIVAASLLIVAAVLAVDMALTDEVRLLGTGEADVDLITRDGRELGWPTLGMRLNFAPLTLYENRPNQSVGGFRINSHGLRGLEITPAPDRPRVVVVGGSAAFGVRVPDDGTLSAALGKQIPASEFLNGGVIGYLSSQELALVVFKLLDLEPSLIIAFNGWNDLYDRYWWASTGSQGTEGYGVNVIFSAIEDRLAKYRRIEKEPSFAALETGRSIMRNSTLLSGLYRVLRPVFSKAPDRQLGQVWSQQLDEAVATYVRNMTMLRDVARSRNSRLIVVVQPELGQLLEPSMLAEFREEKRNLNGDDQYWVGFPASYADFRRRIVWALSSAGVNVIDGSARLSEAGGDSALFVDPVHLEPRGYALIARAIREDVQRELAEIAALPAGDQRGDTD
jgi:lysophospholipase L1-like esterase